MSERWTKEGAVVTMQHLREQLDECEAEVERLNRMMVSHEACCRQSERLREALKEIASYNTEELRSWEEENAADMTEIARAALDASDRGGSVPAT